MLTDEEILREWGGSDATRPTLGKSKVLSFARAVIAADQAKRMQPEEWLRQCDALIAQACANAVNRDAAEMIEARNTLIAHISAPPAGMVLVPEEPTEAMKRALYVNLVNGDTDAQVIKAVIAAAKGEKK